MIILDTNVLSEVLKPAPSEHVLGWLAAQEPSEVFITTVTQAEVLYGIEILPAGERRTRLSGAVAEIFAQDFAGRILPFDEEAAHLFPQIVANRERAGRPISQFDALIASCARFRRAAIATCNTADFEGCGIRIVNPWTAE